MKKMKYLPIFLNLKYKSILIIGGGNIAYRKIILLYSFHSFIKIISKKICKKLYLYILKKKIKWISYNFSYKYLKNIFLVILATNNKDFNKKIFNVINKKNILINTVDNEKYCTFIFPSIVNRNPIIISISSFGKSPVLIRLLREKIESILSINYGNIAFLSGKFRNFIKKIFYNFSNRRLFWEKLFNSNFVDQVINNNIKYAIQTLYHFIINNKKNKGELILVGAGPGDSNLLTLRGLQILQRADIILYDYFISKEILNYARKDAELICVGKRFGYNSIKQNNINKLLIYFIKKGNRVVRLKGGDSFIFGRGAEELLIAKKFGINFQIVPGITSAIGISSYIGVPLTCRNYSNNVLFVTASKYLRKNSILYSKVPDTLVIYMCRNKIKFIFKELLLKGFMLKTPISLISYGTLSYQKVYFGILKNINIISKNISGPILLIIGKVVNLHKKLSWFKNFI